MFKEQLFLLFIIYIRDSSCAVDAIYDIEREIWNLQSIVHEKTLNSTDTINGLSTDNTARNQEIQNQMDEIHKQLDQLEESMNPKTVRDLFKSWPFNIFLYKSIDTVEIFALRIDEYYKVFRHHMNESNHNSNEVREYLDSILPNIEDGIYVIRKNVIDSNEFLPHHRNLIFAITGYAVILQPEFCGNTRAMSHFLVQLFRMVMVAEMKVNIILAIARLHRFPLFAGWMGLHTSENFDRQFQLYVNLFSANIQLTDITYLRACDPPGNIWIRDESFYELEGTFQTAIFHYDSMKCDQDNCDNAGAPGADVCDAQYYDARSGCSGTLNECTYLYTMEACVLKSGPHKFQYANSSRWGLFGENFDCPKDDGYIVKAENSTYGTCACACNENGSNISLFLMESLVQWNMVITGLRFIRKDQILYIQPREGRLGANGHVFGYSQRWIPIPKNIPKSQINLINDENKVFFTDNVWLPQDFVLTGVRFNKVIRGTIAGFAIKIYGVPFDYKTGKLNSDSQFLVSQEVSYDNPGKPLSFVAISSAHRRVLHTPSPGNIKFVKLGKSELHNDFGQSTLPLFDAAPITTYPPSLLGGIGIFHKGADNCAGFISLRVYGIRYAKYFADFQSIYMKNNTMILQLE